MTCEPVLEEAHACLLGQGSADSVRCTLRRAGVAPASDGRSPGGFCRPAPEGLCPFRNVRQTARRSRVGNGATAVRQGHLPCDALDLAEEMPFRGEEEGMLMLLSPFPALVPGFLLLRPGQGMSSSGSPPSGLRGAAADWRRGSLPPSPPPAEHHRP